MKVGEVLTAVGRPVAYYPSLARAVGSINAGLLLCQLIYWADKGTRGRGFLKTSAELFEETGLTYREQLSARKRLRELGITRERYARTEHQTHFEIDFPTLNRTFEASSQSDGAHRNKVTMASSQSDGRRQRLHREEGDVASRDIYG